MGVKTYRPNLWLHWQRDADLCFYIAKRTANPDGRKHWSGGFCVLL